MVTIFRLTFVLPTTDRKAYVLAVSKINSIVHPCNAWASSAGYSCWADALKEMREGKVLRGSLYAVSPGSKSMLGMQIFMDQVASENLHAVIDEQGDCHVGQEDCFAVDVLDAQKTAVENFYPNI